MIRIVSSPKLALVALSISSLLMGCANAPNPPTDLPPPTQEKPQVPTTSLSERQKIINSFLQVFHRWEGAPYQFGGVSKNGVDCSAFVQIAFRDAVQTQLPRTTYYQVQMGEKMSYDNAKPGDLVFFKPSRDSRHVGVYLGSKQFMHASQSKGVIISRLDNPYWASTFWQFRRVLDR